MVENGRPGDIDDITIGQILGRFRNDVKEQLNVLRADLVSEPGRTDLKRALLDYAHTRLMSRQQVKTNEARKETVIKTMAAQEKIWPALMRVVHQQNSGPLKTALVSSVNDVLDAHTYRLAAAFFWNNWPAKGRGALAPGRFDSGRSLCSIHKHDGRGCGG